MKHLLAQALTINGTQGSFTLNGPLPAKFATIGDVVTVVMQAVFPLALFVLFIYLLWSGFDMARSWNSPELIKKAKSRITNSIVGIIMLALSYWLAQIATKIFWG
ncbi:MAG: hypothetical protein WC775_02815 [Patescibacteria group bacterium]|jgi:hypothetical protein